MKNVMKHLTMVAGALALITGGYLVYTHCCTKIEHFESFSEIRDEVEQKFITDEYMTIKI